MDEQLIFTKTKTGMWKNVISGGRIYTTLENAMRSVFKETGHRTFRMEDDEVYLILTKPKKRNMSGAPFDMGGQL
ncbi:hypothetical protein LCGC14_1683290 [marine sediment metagenome]|uniref:Uncharacterized protein n=1 Tax=marine sediment metagenome TaxID=412755 RepID=A0A0F9IAF5_9ZZZZ|nr:hypothetical protein [Candidatus Scalindua sp.]